MRSLIPVVLLANLACGGGSGAVGPSRPQPSRQEPATVSLRFSLDEGDSVVYRRIGVTDPEIHWVERRRDGSVVLGADDVPLRDAGRHEMPADLVFPLTERPIGREPLRARREVVVNDVRLLVEEELAIAGATEREATVQFRRTTFLIDPTGASRPAPLTVQSGEATFDMASGRYSRIRFEESRDRAFGGGSATTEWVYDAALSAERTAAGRQLSTVEEETADPDAEIARVVEALAEPNAPIDTLGFHVRAHPAKVWRAVLESPRSAIRFVSAPPVIEDLRRGAADEVVALVRSRWADATFAHPLIAGLADERFRPELRWLADRSGPTRGEARLSLQALDLGSNVIADRWRPLVRFPTRLRAVWERLSASPARDPSALVPLFIELASTPGTTSAVRDICLDVVRRAGFPGTDPDRRLWRQWWAAEGSRSWGERLVAAFEAAPPDQTANALSLLAAGPDTEATREALATAQGDESLRLAAVIALARRKDRRAAAHLVAALEDPATSRDALAALGFLADSTGGFDPAAPIGSPQRAAALGRWRAWLGRDE